MNIKVRTNIYLTEKQRQALAALSEQTGAPVAELVRRAIDLYLQEKKRPDPPRQRQ